jgi:hypothetical protein
LVAIVSVLVVVAVFPEVVDEVVCWWVLNILFRYCFLANPFAVADAMAPAWPRPFVAFAELAACAEAELLEPPDVLTELEEEALAEDVPLAPLLALAWLAAWAAATPWDPAVTWAELDASAAAIPFPVEDAAEFELAKALEPPWEALAFEISITATSRKSVWANFIVEVKTKYWGEVHVNSYKNAM